MTSLNTVTISASLFRMRGIDCYTQEGAARKKAFHSLGKKFLKDLALGIGDRVGNFSIRSNLGGIAVSGEVTLHSDHLYVQLSESCMSTGISMLYRSCESQKDYTGHRNNFFGLEACDDGVVPSRILVGMAALVDAESFRKDNAISRA